MNTSAALKNGMLDILPDDRREALRQPALALDIEIECEGLNWQNGLLQDVSRTGLRFRTLHRYQVGVVVVLHPPTDTGLQPSHVEIVREIVREDGDGVIYEYGTRFTEDEAIHRHAWFLKLRQEYK